MFQTLMANPVVAAGSAAVAAAAIIALWSSGMLLSTLLYQPTLNIRNTVDTQVSADINPSEISNRNFFGLADAEPTIMLDQLPETKLELVLRGAFAALDEANAGAIIEDDRKISQHYAVGDEVPGDATLKSVHNDRVGLVRNGIFETLYFPDAQTEKDPSGDIVRSGFDNNSRPSTDLTRVSASEAQARRDAIRERINKLKNQKKR
jgi:general secretion pathway protein C